MRRAYRQGDLLFIAVDSLPDNAVPEDTDVIAEGEVSGHVHRVVGGQILSVPETDFRYVDGEDFEVVHDEHPPLRMSGPAEIIQQREYSPPESQGQPSWRPVVD